MPVSMREIVSCRSPALSPSAAWVSPNFFRALRMLFPICFGSLANSAICLLCGRYDKNAISVLAHKLILCAKSHSARGSLSFFLRRPPCISGVKEVSVYAFTSFYDFEALLFRANNRRTKDFGARGLNCNHCFPHHGARGKSAVRFAESADQRVGTHAV